MERIPDMVVLDFLEWMNRAVLTDYHYTDVDMWDLFFDEENAQMIYQRAEEYCHMRKQQSQDLSNYKCCIYKNVSDLQANGLIDNVKELFKDYSKQEVKSPVFKQIVKGRSIEIDFLEWIERNYCSNSGLLKIDLMPLEMFEEFANKFSFETGRDKSDVKKLVKLFKQSDPGTLEKRLYDLLPYESKYYKKNLKYISHRYLNEEGLHKCVILPLERDKQYKQLISKYWTSLDKMSADYLDIYYCYTNYGKSGYRTMEALNYLPQKMNGELPCILLWKNDMEQAGIITIKQLSADEVFYVISHIVKLIAKGLELDDIVREANKMSKEQKAKVVNNSIINYGNMGSAINGDYAEVEVVFNAVEHEQFLVDAQKAHKIITESDELNDEQKKELLSIITEAQESVKEGSKTKAENSKTRFKSFVVFCGNTATKLIAALAGLVSIANFFNLR